MPAARTLLLTLGAAAIGAALLWPRRKPKLASAADLLAAAARQRDEERVEQAVAAMCGEPPSPRIYADEVLRRVPRYAEAASS